MVDPRASYNYINADKLELAEQTVDTVFKERIKCTRHEHIILLLKAYSNVLDGCTIIAIDKQVPEHEFDSYKQYDHKCRVLFEGHDGSINQFYMSYHSSGKEAVNYWRLKYELSNKENIKLRKGLDKVILEHYRPNSQKEPDWSEIEHWQDYLEGESNDY